MATRKTRDDELTQVGRLAFRQEGKWWNAYWARNESMEGAVLLGSVLMSAVRLNPEVQAQFLMTMRAVMSDLCEMATGIRPTWKEPVSAPEHEKAGHG